jgi:hypothetical protein
VPFVERDVPLGAQIGALRAALLDAGLTPGTAP